MVFRVTLRKESDSLVGLSFVPNLSLRDMCVSSICLMNKLQIGLLMTQLLNIAFSAFNNQDLDKSKKIKDKIIAVAIGNCLNSAKSPKGNPRMMENKKYGHWACYYTNTLPEPCSK